MDDTKNQLKLSNYLLAKYADIINEREQRTIGEVKALVDGRDLTISNFVDQFKDEYYEFDKNYFETLKKCFEEVNKTINYTKTDFRLNFWLSPQEVLELKVVDDEDLAVFMCNAMKSMGDNNANVVIAEMENLKTHAFVTTQIGEKFLIIDASQKHTINDFYGEKTDIIRKYTFNESKIKRFLYRFNSDKYEQFLDE